jgi:hypothetical protein
MTLRIEFTRNAFPVIPARVLSKSCRRVPGVFRERARRPGRLYMPWQFDKMMRFGVPRPIRDMDFVRLGGAAARTTMDGQLVSRLAPGSVSVWDEAIGKR